MPKAQERASALRKERASEFRSPEALGRKIEFAVAVSFWGSTADVAFTGDVRRSGACMGIS